MPETEFREWLKRRAHQGSPLTATGVNSRVRKLPRIERALAELGFAEPNLDAVYASGRWPDLVKAVGKIAADWRSNEPAARKMAPQAPDPTRQLSNLINVARQYGHFLDGKEPNYDVEADEPGASEIDQGALGALKARFLAKFQDFESGGGFPGESSYHREEDSYKRPLIANVRSLAQEGLSEAVLGGQVLSLVLDDKDMNLVGDYRRKTHLKEVRERAGGKLEEAVGKLAMSHLEPPDAAAQFVADAWEFVLKGSEHSKPYGDIRTLATLFQALTRPDEAISVATRKFENLGKALLGRRLFGDNVLTADEYRGVLDLASELFDIIGDWGWQPRDLWDVQGFIWVTCDEKVEEHRERDADRIRQHVLENYIEPARERQANTVDVLVRNVNEALGLNQAWPNICQALAGRKFLEMAEVAPPERIGKDQSSATVFRFRTDGIEGKQMDLPVSHPTNLILYGPPGTGKTYATAEEAVKLCDGVVPADRDALMVRYRELGSGLITTR